MYKGLYNIISNISGFVLAIGLDDKLAEKIDKNSKILKCDILNYVPNKFGESKKKKREKFKKISIKKLKKIYKKKNVDYIICNYSHIEKFLNTFISDSIYIGKTKIYFFGNVDKELVMKRYQRYDTTIEIKDYKKSSIVEINIEKSKNSFIKEMLYKVVDGFNNFIEFIGDILMG